MTSAEMQEGLARFREIAKSAPTDIGARRELVALMVAQRPIDPDIHTTTVDVGPGAEWIWTDDARPGRTILYFHGGGYVTGSAAATRPFAGRMSHATAAWFLSVDYRLAPESPFPSAVDDALTCHRWLLGTTPPQRILFAGDSAGGGLAIATAIAAREAGMPLPSGILTLSPWLDLTVSSASMLDEASEDPFGTAADWRRSAEHYLSGAAATDPLASPLYADLAGLPPIHIEAGSTERLRDEIAAFAAKASNAGIDVTCHLTPGGLHCFPMHLPAAPESRVAFERITAWANGRLGEPGLAAG
jgi:monoterpene epsilon-lactone hydrolase